MVKLLYFLSVMAVTAALVIRPGAVSAQADSHAGHEASRSIPLELLKRPLTLRGGIGKIRDAVTTSSEEAHEYYNQGIAYLHSYVWIEAARSFNQALRLDPKFAMAYWGLSRAYSGLNSAEAARAAIMGAQAFTSQVGPRERRRIAVRLIQLDAIAAGGAGNPHFKYKKALDEALVIDPEDVELWLLRGNAEEPSAAGRGQRGGEEALSFYMRALALSPDHFGAHHYLTHSYENLGRLEDALRHGEIHARLAPSIPHARHMYGHNLRRVGRTEEAIAEFVEANRLELDYYKSEGIPAHYDWHHQHNLELLAASYRHQGRMKEAEKVLRDFFAIPSMLSAQEITRREWPAFLISRGRYNEALEAARALTEQSSGVVQAMGYIMASHAQMAAGNLAGASDEAKSALSVLDSAGNTLPVVATHLAVLQGEFFLRTGQSEKGRSMLKGVQPKIRAEPGPDSWIEALFRLEMIWRAARDVGDWNLAEFTAKQMIEHDPSYAGAHYAMALTAEQRGDTAAALAGFENAEKYWRRADQDLPELANTHAKIIHLKD